MHIGLTGGPATGKTTLAEALISAVPELVYVYMSLFGVRIPMTLKATTHPEILEYSRNKYITAILANQNVSELHFSRAEMDAYGKLVFERHGPAVIGETVLDAIPSGRIAVLDGVATPENIQYLKGRGVHVVGLDCLFETRVQRRLEKPRDIDPKGRSQLERQLRETDAHYQTEECLRIAHAVYNTDRMRAAEIAQIVAPRIRD